MYAGKRLFATKKANVSALLTLYAMAQCTPDLSAEECDRCLMTSLGQIPILCPGQSGGGILEVDCVVRFETYQFYNNPELLQAQPSLPPNPRLTVPPNQPPSPEIGKGGMSNKVIIAAIAVSAGGFVLVASLILVYCFWCWRPKKRKRHHELMMIQGNGIVTFEGAADIASVKSLQYDFEVIRAATGDFSDENKVGQGGFGSVYKGVLVNGTQVAVKRLSSVSAQGAIEFKMEVAVVAKLQHKNLARLLGFCLEGVERILIYEFITNRSLDYFIFHPKQKKLLDWSRRYKIIQGIARGLLYLHEDSRLRIVHRDLKASNILLDGDMNPKIADFGMARIVGADFSEESTKRIVGTYGHMPPEYAMRGQVSVKLDVYSFGVLVLEIISGKKNTNYVPSDGNSDLLSYAWRHWRDGTSLDLIDPCLMDAHSRNEVLRCIHMALLCVQKNVSDRPTMHTIALILNSYSVPLTQPHPPGFFIGSQEACSFPMHPTISTGISSFINKVSAT